MTTQHNFGGMLHAVRSPLAAALGFVALRVLLTPVRIKVVTQLLTPGDYGILTLLSMTAHGFALLASLGGFEVLLRKLPAADEDARLGLFGSVLIQSTVVGALAAVGLGMLWHRVGVLSELASAIPFGVVLCLLLLFLHIQQKCHWLLGCRQYWRARWVQLLWSDLWFLPLLVFLLGAGSVSAGRGAGIWVAWLVAVLLLTWRWVPIRKSLGVARRSPQMAAVFFAGMPILPVILGEWIFRLSGHYALLAYWDASAMAFYALAMNVALVGLVVGTPLVDMCGVELGHALGNLSGTERGYASVEARRVFSRGLRHLCAGLLPVALAMIFLPTEIIRLLASARFIDAAAYLPAVAVLPALLSLNLLLARMLMLLGKSRSVSGGAMVSGLAAVALCVILVPHFRINGAMMGIVLSCGLTVVFYAIRLRLWRWLDPVALGGWRTVLAMVAMGAAFPAAAALAVPGPVRILVAGGMAMIVILGGGLLRPSDFARSGEQSQG